MSTADKINLAIAIATAAASLASLCVVYLTLRVLQANRAAVSVMQAQLEATSRPYMLITPKVRPMTTFVELFITNTGASAAENLRLTLDRDYHFNAEEGEHKNLRRYPAFVHPIDAFAPKAEVVFGLGVGHRILASDLSPRRFTISATYSSGGKEYREETRIDLQPYIQSGQPVDAVAERLDKLVTVLEKRSKES